MRQAVRVHPAAQRHCVHQRHAGPGGRRQHEAHATRVQGRCTLMDYYLDELKAAPGVLKYIANGKLVLTGKGGGAYCSTSSRQPTFHMNDTVGWVIYRGVYGS